MAQHTYIVYNKDNKAAVDAICTATYMNTKFFIEDRTLTEDVLVEMATCSGSEYFYVINTDKEVLFPEFDFYYKPPTWDKQYVHVWDNDTTVRQYCREEVLANPSHFTDDALVNGRVQLKNIDGKIYTDPVFDIVFLSYDEAFAGEHYHKLKSRFPRTKRVNGVKGIYEAHKAAASIVTSSMFYVVDADAVLLDDFDFSYNPHSVDRVTTHVWQSINPINDLKYGYGGVKLFPTELLKNYKGLPVDFTTSVSSSFKVMDEVSNITKFNTDPFTTWRSAFRECAKLASGAIHNNKETTDRLDIWCTVGSDREFGDFALMGANEGREFGMKNINHPEQIRMINDYKWLEERFTS